jgi:hypothetical protein
MAVVIASGFADGITMDAEKLNRAINRLPTVLALEMRAALLNIGAEHVKRVKQNFTTYSPGKNNSDQLQVRSNALRNAIGPSDLSGSSLASLRLTQIVRRPKNGRLYSPLQELGGTVRPKKPRRALTMPIGVALDPSGKLRTKFRVRRDGTWKSGKPRWVTNEGLPTFILRKGGRAFVAYRRPNMKSAEGRNKAIVIYRLLDEARIPPRLAFGRIWGEMRAYQEGQLRGAVERTVGRLEGT